MDPDEAQADVATLEGVLVRAPAGVAPDRELEQRGEQGQPGGERDHHVVREHGRRRHLERHVGAHRLKGDVQRRGRRGAHGRRGRGAHRLGHVLLEVDGVDPHHAVLGDEDRPRLLEDDRLDAFLDVSPRDLHLERPERGGVEAGDDGGGDAHLDHLVVPRGHVGQVQRQQERGVGDVAVAAVLDAEPELAPGEGLPELQVEPALLGEDGPELLAERLLAEDEVFDDEVPALLLPSPLEVVPDALAAEFGVAPVEGEARELQVGAPVPGAQHARFVDVEDGVAGRGAAEVLRPLPLRIVAVGQDRGLADVLLGGEVERVLGRDAVPGAREADALEEVGRGGLVGVDPEVVGEEGGRIGVDQPGAAFDRGQGEEQVGVAFPGGVGELGGALGLPGGGGPVLLGRGEPGALPQLGEALPFEPDLAPVLGVLQDPVQQLFLETGDVALELPAGVPFRLYLLEQLHRLLPIHVDRTDHARRRIHQREHAEERLRGDLPHLALIFGLRLPCVEGHQHLQQALAGGEDAGIDPGVVLGRHVGEVALEIRLFP